MKIKTKNKFSFSKNKFHYNYILPNILSQLIGNQSIKTYSLFSICINSYS